MNFFPVYFFSPSLCSIRCHTDLNSFPQKKISCRESKLPQREKNEEKSDNLQHPGRPCSSALTKCTVLECSYSMTLNFNTETKFFYPQLLFLWVYIAPLANLPHLIIEKLVAILFLQVWKHWRVWNTGVEVREPWEKTGSRGERNILCICPTFGLWTILRWWLLYVHPSKESSIVSAPNRISIASIA
jgi:hypothetical protein